MCRAEIFLRRRPRHLGPPVGGMPIKCSETIRAAAVAKEFLRACEALIAVPIPKISNYGRSANSTSFFPKIKWIHRFCLETRKSAKAQGCSNEALFRKYGLGGKSAGLPEKLSDVSPLLSGRIFVLFFGREIFYHHQVPHRRGAFRYFKRRAGAVRYSEGLQYGSRRHRDVAAEKYRLAVGASEIRNDIYYRDIAVLAHDFAQIHVYVALRRRVELSRAARGRWGVDVPPHRNRVSRGRERRGERKNKNRPRRESACAKTPALSAQRHFYFSSRLDFLKWSNPGPAVLISASKNPCNWRMRVGWRILRSAFASIWRMRSRVTLNCLPTSSSVRE